MFVGAPFYGVGSFGPFDEGRLQSPQRGFRTRTRRAGHCSVRTLALQASGPHRARSSRKKTKRRASQTEGSTEEFEITDIPLSNFSFIQADGSVDWERFETFSSRSWEETQTIVREVPEDLPLNADPDVIQASDEQTTELGAVQAVRVTAEVAGPGPAALTLSRDELQSPGKYERITSLGALGVIARDGLVEPLDTAARALREQELVYVTFSVSLERDGDAFVRGRVRTRFRNESCDRCATRLEMEVRSSFDVWMASREDAIPNAEAGDPRIEEAIEPFHAGIEAVDFTKHVREAIWLGIPSRVLCADQQLCRTRMQQIGWQFSGNSGDATIQNFGPDDLVTRNQQRSPSVIPQKDARKSSKKKEIQPGQRQPQTTTQAMAVDTRTLRSLAARNPEAAKKLSEIRERLLSGENEQQMPPRSPSSEGPHESHPRT